MAAIAVNGFGLKVAPKGRFGVKLRHGHEQLTAITDQYWFVIGDKFGK
jgi:hypothetical protein